MNIIVYTFLMPLDKAAAVLDALAHLISALRLVDKLYETIHF
jgi:hypothetical protein